MSKLRNYERTIHPAASRTFVREPATCVDFFLNRKREYVLTMDRVQYGRPLLEVHTVAEQYVRVCDELPAPGRLKEVYGRIVVVAPHVNLAKERFASSCIPPPPLFPAFFSMPL